MSLRKMACENIVPKAKIIIINLQYTALVEPQYILKVNKKKCKSLINII